jgi:hypothetical protein
VLLFALCTSTYLFFAQATAFFVRAGGGAAGANSQLYSATEVDVDAKLLRKVQEMMTDIRQKACSTEATKQSKAKLLAKVQHAFTAEGPRGAPALQEVLLALEEGRNPNLLFQMVMKVGGLQG